MSGSTEPRAVLVSPEDHGTIMSVTDIQRDAFRLDELNEACPQTQEVLMKVAQYSQPIREVQMVCNHPQQIIDQQRQITNLQTKQFLPPPIATMPIWSGKYRL
jgi:hypothetical protein